MSWLWRQAAENGLEIKALETEWRVSIKLDDAPQSTARRVPLRYEGDKLLIIILGLCYESGGSNEKSHWGWEEFIYLFYWEKQNLDNVYEASDFNTLHSS